MEEVRRRGVGVSGGCGTIAGCMRVVDGGAGGENDGGVGGRATRGGGGIRIDGGGGGAEGREGWGRGGGTVRATTRKAELDDVSATAECSAESLRGRHRTA